MAWSTPYKTILEASYLQWKSAKNEAKRNSTIYPTLISAIKKHHNEVLTANGRQADPLPKDLQKKVTNWMNNYVRLDSEDGSAPPEDTRGSLPTARQVVISMFSAEIEIQIRLECDEDSDPKAADFAEQLHPGQPGYLRYFQQAVSTVHAVLDDDQLELIEETLKDWKVRGLPGDVRKRSVSIPNKTRPKSNILIIATPRRFLRHAKTLSETCPGPGLDI